MSRSVAAPEGQERPVSSAIGVACVAACGVGLLGADSGLVWIIAGVFTLRSVAGAPPGLTWAIACLGAGLRWGTLSLGDVETSTRLLGATVVSGGPSVRFGMTAAVVAAFVDEARHGGALAGSWLERSASVAAAVTVVPLFLTEGPTTLSASVALWVVAALGAMALTVALGPFVRRLPWWLPGATATAGVVVAEVVS